MEGWVDLVDLIAPRPGVEPTTFQSRVQRSTNATTKTTACTCLCFQINDEDMLCRWWCRYCTVWTWRQLNRRLVTSGSTYPATESLCSRHCLASTQPNVWVPDSDQPRIDVWLADLRTASSDYTLLTETANEADLITNLHLIWNTACQYHAEETVFWADNTAERINDLIQNAAQNQRARVTSFHLKN